MSSFIAAGTAYATHGISMIPFFIFYSMFGFQRVADLIWAAGDSRAKGFLLGATAGRTTLNGEGLQHQDGSSHVMACCVPNVRAYDPAYAYELAIIIRDGIERMADRGEDVFYYITLMNEFYAMPPLPVGAEEGIIRGMYQLRPTPDTPGPCVVHLLGSGTILGQALRAQEILTDRFGVAADVWSVTSYRELYRDACDTQRWNALHPQEPPRLPYLAQHFPRTGHVFVAASDYLKLLPCAIAPWLPGRLVALGTDGFGRSDSREALRDFFEVDYRFIALGALHALASDGHLPRATVLKAMKELHINPDKPNPVTA
jgi:pyruvate dehydrogenase E1 component